MTFPKHKRICVTGVPGVGKSTILSALKERGFHTLGTEEDGLCSWRHRDTGEQVTREKLVDESFAAEHRLMCDIAQLQMTMSTIDERVVVCGVVSNQEEFLKLFDTILLLQCLPETLIKRLEGRTNKPFPKGSFVQRRVLSRQTAFDQEMLEHGAVPIDAERPLEQVIDDIVSHLQ
jgi:thymidylate kinase